MTWGRRTTNGRDEKIKQKTFLIHVKDSLRTTKFNSQVFLLFLADSCEPNKALEHCVTEQAREGWKPAGKTSSAVVRIYS